MLGATSRVTSLYHPQAFLVNFSQIHPNLSAVISSGFGQAAAFGFGFNPLWKAFFLRCCWVQRQEQYPMSPSVAETRLSSLFPDWALTMLVLISRSCWWERVYPFFPRHCHIWILLESSLRGANHRLLLNCSQYRRLRVMLLKWQSKKWKSLFSPTPLTPSTPLSNSQFQFQKKKWKKQNW